jgi:hypothetical protein
MSWMKEIRGRRDGDLSVVVELSDFEWEEPCCDNMMAFLGQADD